MQESQHFVTPSRGIARVYETIARWAFYLMVLLVPIMYIPWTVDALEVNKQTTVVLLTAVAVISWLGMMVVRKRFFFKKTALFIIPALLILSVGLSSLFSIAPYSSWFGQGTQEYLSFFSILSFGLLFIVGAHFLSETVVQRRVWWLSLCASAIVGLVVILGIAGMPIINSNLIGTPNSLGLYLVVMTVLGSSLWLVDGSGTQKQVMMAGGWNILQKIAIVITCIATIITLLTIDYWMLWVASIIGVGIVFVFALIRAQEFPQTSRFVLPMILFVISLLFLFLPTFMPKRFAVEIAPSFKASINIAKDTLREHSFLFGSGGGTYAMDYAQFASADINGTNFWDIRFDRSGSHILTLATTWGIAGVLFMLIFSFSIMALALKQLIFQKEHDEWKMTFIAFSGWVVLLFGLFTYSSNFTLTFLFWILSAVLASQFGPIVRQWEFSKNTRFGLLTAFLFVIVNVGLLTVAFMSVSRYAAEVSYAKAVQQDQTNAPIEEMITSLDTAARLNKLSDVYYRNLANALLVKAGNMVMEEDMYVNQLREVVGLSINAAKKATILSPNNVVNWHLLGDVYREVSPVVGSADLFSISAYQNATLLAPNNPKYRVALARSYLVRAENLLVLMDSEDEAFAQEAEVQMQEAYTLAVQELNNAIELKFDYAPAHYYLSIAYERQGNIEDAIARMESVKSVALNDTGVALQLGLLYLRQGKVAQAQLELERAIAIAPNFSNARWYLSYVYEQIGDFESAIEQVEQIKDTNPDNPLVDQRLADLNAGLISASLPEPLEAGEEQGVVEDSIIVE